MPAKMNTQPLIAHARRVAYLGSADKIRAEVTRYFGVKPSPTEVAEIGRIAAERAARQPQPSRQPKERGPRRLINTERNAAILRDRERGVTRQQMADKYGLSVSTIADILRGDQRS